VDMEALATRPRLNSDLDAVIRPANEEG
jgi:hypothetical protein